jgi:hypothetical protein
MSEETHLIIFEYEPSGRNREPVHTSTYDIRGILSDGSELRILQSFPPPHEHLSNNLEDTWDEFESAYLTRPGFVKATCLVQVHSLALQDSEIITDLKERLAETGEDVIYMNTAQEEEKEEDLNEYTFINSAGIKQTKVMISKETPTEENINVKLFSEFEKFLNKPIHVPRIIRRGEHKYDVLFVFKLPGSVSRNTLYSDRIFAKGYKTRRNKGKRTRRSIRGKGKKTRGKKTMRW